MMYRLILAALLTFLCCRNLALGAPLSSPLFRLLEPREEIRFITNYRSTPEIIWTCLITTFLCTWTSVHPDVIGYGSSSWQRLRRRVFLCIYTFACPEATLLMAVAQWLATSYITSKIGIPRPSWKERMESFVASIVPKSIAKKMGIEEDDGSCFSRKIYEFRSSICSFKPTIGRASIVISFSWAASSFPLTGSSNIASWTICLKTRTPKSDKHSNVCPHEKWKYSTVAKETDSRRASLSFRSPGFLSTLQHEESLGSP